MALTTYALARVRPTDGKAGRKPFLDDPKFRAELLMCAAAGVSRRGCAKFVGVSPQRLHEWLARGSAQTEIEPYSSFFVEFTRAERMLEVAASSALAREVQRLARHAQRGGQLSSDERAFVFKFLVTRYPAEHGTSAEHRQVDAEPDPEAWWQKHGLTHDQLCAVFRDPPEAIAKAQLSVAEIIVARLLADGWKPSDALCAAVDVRRKAMPRKADVK